MGVCCAAEDTAQVKIEKAQLARQPANPYEDMYKNGEKEPEAPKEMKIAEGDGTPKLYYMDIYGRAEPIRLVLEYGKIKYDDIRFTFQTFTEWTKVAPNGKYPVYVDEEGRQYDQSFAITIMLAKKVGLYSSDPDEAYVSDWAIDTNYDLLKQEFARAIGTPGYTEE